MDYRLAIIGAGPGGYVAAIRGAQLGMKVCLIERDEVGGVCLNWGCIPTKTLAASAKVFSLIKRAAEFGIGVSDIRLESAQMYDRKDQVVKRLVNGILFLLQKNKIDLVRGSASFLTEHELIIAGNDGSERRITAESIIIASGSIPQLPEIFQYDGLQVISSNEALSFTSLPTAMVIVGGGVVGCEFASIFNILGVKVTLVEMLPNLLPNLDPEVSSSLRLQFKKKGITVLTATPVREIRKNSDHVDVIVGEGQELKAEKVLVAIGRKPNITGLNLDKIGIDTAPNGRIKVNPFLETNWPGIFAIGDVNDQPWDLAHAASAQGIIAVSNINGERSAWSDLAMPNCIFTDPEIAAVGLSATEAATAGIEVTVAKFPLLANGKALADGEAVGFVKVIAGKSSGQILGVHMIGLHASDLIAEAALAIRNKLTVTAVMETIHAHPTLAEAFHEACEGIMGLSIHV